MLTKILLTLLVISIAWWFVSRTREQANDRQQILLMPQKLIQRYLMIGLLILLFIGGIGLGVWHLYDGYKIVNVTIVSPFDSQTVTYQVRKRDIQSEQFTSLNGLKIRISNQERMIISAN